MVIKAGERRDTERIAHPMSYPFFIINLPNNLRTLSVMDKIMTPFDYINANQTLFRLRLVCKITDVNENVDTCVMKGNHENVGYIKTELNFCVNLEGVAYNDFDDIRVNVRHSFDEDRSKQKKCLELYKEICHGSEAVLLSGDCYGLVDDEITFYSPELKRLGFKYAV
jgi:hypothetical protein